MKRRGFGFKGSVLFLMVILLTHLLFPFGTFATAEAEKVDVLVTYEEDSSKLVDAFDRANYENVVVMGALPIITMTVPEQEIERLEGYSNVVSVSIDQPLHLMVEEVDSSRELSEYDWNNEMVKAFDAWDDGYTGNGVRVAVLDTGFDEHQDITYAGGHSVFEDDVYTYDYDGHGTHVAGIIGAQKGTTHQGIAPNVELYGVKVFSESTGGTTTDLISGIDWSIQEGMDIINMSLGFTGEVPAVLEAIQEAVEQGILVIAASGNEGNEDGTGEQIEYPAKYDEVIAVASVDQDLSRSTFSAAGPENEVAAPGGFIGGLAPGGSYVAMSGTSQATPHVTALAAILMEKYPQRSNEEIRELLIKKANDLGPEGRDSLYGYGLVQYAPLDIEPPVIEYDGELEIEVEYGAEFIVPAVTVTDNVDEDIEATVTIYNEEEQVVKQSDIDTTIPATYVVEYTAVDEAGNEAVPLYITITVLEEGSTPPEEEDGDETDQDTGKEEEETESGREDEDTESEVAPPEEENGDETDKNPGKGEEKDSEDGQGDRISG